MVVCGDEVVVAAARNVVDADDVVATDGVVVTTGAMTVFVVWVQQC